jgi:hypothetical protein
MKTILPTIASIFTLISGAFYAFHYFALGLLFTILAILSWIAVLIVHFKHKQRSKEKGDKNMKIIGKKVVVSIGGEPPQDDQDEIIGEKTIVHVPTSEIGKHKKIIGSETTVIVGNEKDKNK